MILVDVNLLLNATVPEAPHHAAIRPWFTQALKGESPLGLPWLSLMGFVRIAGQSRAWRNPLPLGVAMQTVAAWLHYPSTWIPEPGPDHFDLVARLLSHETSHRLVTDAQLGAIAIAHGLTVYSLDGDFARWQSDGVRSRNPLKSSLPTN